jgi:3D (Asp-Asp-Asp) domain-containing protein
VNIKTLSTRARRLTRPLLGFTAASVLAAALLFPFASPAGAQAKTERSFSDQVVSDLAIALTVVDPVPAPPVRVAADRIEPSPEELRLEIEPAAILTALTGLSPAEWATLTFSGNPAGPGARFLGSFKVTCYSLQGITASGAPVALDGVAVDPRVIPLGAEIYMDGLGWKVARDTGGAILGNTIDIWNPSYDSCIQWGVRYVDVWAPAT